LVHNVNTKSTLQYQFEYFSDVSFIGITFSRNWHSFSCDYFRLGWNSVRVAARTLLQPNRT